MMSPALSCFPKNEKLKLTILNSLTSCLYQQIGTSEPLLLKCGSFSRMMEEEVVHVAIRLRPGQNEDEDIKQIRRPFRNNAHKPPNHHHCIDDPSQEETKNERYV